MFTKNRISLKAWGIALVCATASLGTDSIDEIQNVKEKIEKNYLKQKKIYSNIDTITQKMESRSITESSGLNRLKNLEEGLSKTTLKEQNLTEKLAKIDRHEYGYNLIGVALFSGTDPVSKAIKKITGSNTSHVGIILSDINNENKWYCFESTGTPDEAMSGIYPHVRVTDWDEVVKEYKGSIRYRLFLYKDMERPDPIKVANLVEKYNEKSYTRNPLILLKALLNKNRPSKGTPGTVFCSELAAITLNHCRILPQTIARNYLPSDFESENMDPGTSMNDRYELTPEFKVEKIPVRKN